MKIFSAKDFSSTAMPKDWGIIAARIANAKLEEWLSNSVTLLQIPKGDDYEFCWMPTDVYPPAQDWKFKKQAKIVCIEKINFETFPWVIRR